MATCTQGRWNVGTSHTGGTQEYYLQPFRVVSDVPWKSAKADCYGKAFASDKDAWAYALDHGYSQTYRGPHGMTRAKHRQFLRTIHDGVMVGFKFSDNYRDLYAIAAAAGNAIADRTGNALDSCHWSVGFMDAARRIRPDLFTERD